MAVQAQYVSTPYFVPRSNNNNNEGFEDHHNIMFPGYNTFGHQILNGAVFSEPESELTCNLSASRKRHRGDDQQQPFIFSKIPRLGEKITTSSNSSLEENRLLGSGRPSTSGRSSPFASQNFNSNLLHQNLEIDALIRLQNEKLRSTLEETRKRHCRSLLSILEHQVLKSLQDKETELANANTKNAELEEKIKQISAENQIWFNVANTNEAIACSLKSSLDQLLIQNQTQMKEGFGDSCDGTGILADDAQSCCNQAPVHEESETERTVQENRELKEKKLCKVCRENDVSVLLLPCRHLCLCKRCESKIEACPICKCVKKASLQIFIS